MDGWVDWRSKNRIKVVLQQSEKNFNNVFSTFSQMSTSAGWDGVLNGIIDEEDCTKDNHETGEAGNCGNTAMGIAFLLSYLVISFLIIINMYIAVILENYSQVK